MQLLYQRFSILLLAVLVVSCAAPRTELPATATTEPSATATISQPEAQIARHPKRADFSTFIVNLEPPKYDPTSDDPFQVDLRSSNLTRLDLSKSKADLMYASFDTVTQWPASDKMPPDFDWQKIMEINTGPGLGIRSLHEQGITGKGISIAIIDQPLLVDHQEYIDRIRLYEEINVTPDTEATMHGAAVTSLVVGKTVGVAPEADMYYIGSWTGDWNAETQEFTWNFEYYAQAVHRVLEINKSLPEEHKIRVIAMQIGWSPERKGYQAITDAVNEAKAQGIFVISSSLSQFYDMQFHGLGKDPLADPDDFASYRPGLFWQKDFYQAGLSSPTLMVPMDSRTAASPTGIHDYVFYRTGGWSWSIPYLAGTYALAAQVKPEITPEEFWETALSTGKTTQIEHEGTPYEFGVILDPQALIEALQSK